MNNKENFKWTRKELENNLPDYLFNKLSELDRAEFEKELPNYPDLIDEVELGRKVFNRIEKIDFDSILDQKTKNMSYNIQNRVSDKYSSKLFFNFSWRLVMPVVGLIAIAAVMYYTGDKNIEENKTASSFELKIKAEEMNKLTAGDNSTAELLELYASADNIQAENSGSSDYIAFDSVKEEVADELIAESIIESVTEKPGNLINDSYISQDDLIETLLNIDDTEFNKLLEEIENADLII